MALSRPPVPDLVGPRVRVILAGPNDVHDLLAFHARNADHLRPWLPPIPADLYSLQYWTRWVAAAGKLYDNDQAVRLLIRLLEGPPSVIGQINYSNVVRGAFHAASVGYHLDQQCQGQGLMREALELSIRFMFNALQLHRIMANYIPGNTRSAKLLERLGFEIEGYARDYLFINGAWRDHVLTARINRDLVMAPMVVSATRRA